MSGSPPPGAAQSGGRVVPVPQELLHGGRPGQHPRRTEFAVGAKYPQRLSPVGPGRLHQADGRRPPLRIARTASSPWVRATRSIRPASSGTLRPALAPNRPISHSAASRAAFARNCASLAGGQRHQHGDQYDPVHLPPPSPGRRAVARRTAGRSRSGSRLTPCVPGRTNWPMAAWQADGTWTGCTPSCWSGCTTPRPRRPSTSRQQRTGP